MGYYQGDFYRGDPGFFSSLGGIFKGIASTAAGFIPGVGGIASKAIQKIPTGGGGIVSRVIKPISGAIIKHPVLTAAGAAGVVGAAGGALARGRAAVAAGAPSGMMRGFHTSKRTGQLVRNRRMRVTNPKALRRAIRRATGFARLARRVLHFTSPRAPRGRAIFKAKRRKK